MLFKLKSDIIVSEKERKKVIKMTLENYLSMEFCAAECLLEKFFEKYKGKTLTPLTEKQIENICYLAADNSERYSIAYDDYFEKEFFENEVSGLGIYFDDIHYIKEFTENIPLDRIDTLDGTVYFDDYFSFVFFFKEFHEFIENSQTF